MPRYDASGSDGRSLGLIAAGLIVLLVLGTRLLGLEGLGVVIFPAAGLLFAVAFGKRCARLRPEEPWLPRLILWGTIAKLAASVARYITLTQAYQGSGDATIYDREGRNLVAFWTGELARSPLDGMALRQSGLIRFITGIVYYLFGQNLLAGFFLFGLVALLGSYFWYRALADSVPYADKRLFLIFMMFAPSLVFWPSGLGKEALMQVGVGAMAWAASLALNNRFANAIPLAAGGATLLYLVRPHLLALVSVASAVPYFLGRINKGGKASFVGRPAGMLILGLFVLFTVTAGIKFLGLEDLSVDSIEARLDEQTATSSYGGSTYEHRGNSITDPLYLPTGFVTVLFRPFLWETGSLFQATAALESAVLLYITFRRFDSVRLAVRRCRLEPFVLYCIMLIILYSATFSSLANFGLLTRQRSLVLPAMYAILALDTAMARRWVMLGKKSGERSDVELTSSGRRGRTGQNTNGS